MNDCFWSAGSTHAHVKHKLDAFDQSPGLQASIGFDDFLVRSPFVALMSHVPILLAATSHHLTEHSVLQLQSMLLDEGTLPLYGQPTTDCGPL